MEPPPDRVRVEDEDGDSIELKRAASTESPFPLLVSVVTKADGSLGQVWLAEHDVRELLSWLSDTIST